MNAAYYAAGMATCPSEGTGSSLLDLFIIVCLTAATLIVCRVVMR
jgi:hypothetical protein